MRRFRVIRLEDADSHDGYLFEATTPGQAAEAWADWDDFNSTEFSIVGGREAPKVQVREVLETGHLGLSKVFTVSGEAVRSYTAKEA